MESFDVAGDEIARWRGSRLSSDPKDSRSLLLQPDQLEPVADLVRTVRKLVEDPDSDVLRRQIERYARTVRYRPERDSDFDGEIEAYFEEDGVRSR